MQNTSCYKMNLNFYDIPSDIESSEKYQKV